MLNQRFSRRSILKWAAAAAVLPMIQACAPPPPPTPTSAPKPAAAAPTPTSAPQPAAATPTPAPAKPPAAAAKVTVRFATWIGSFKPLSDVWNQTRSSSSNIETVFEQSPFAQYADKILVDVAAGTAADVFNYPGINWPPFMMKKVTYVIDELLKRDKVDMSAFDLAPEKLCSFEGKLWGLPYGLPSSWGMGYNERMFKAANLEIPNEKWTWDDVTAALLKIHKPPDAYGMLALRHLDVLASFVLSNGGKLFTADEKKSLLDTPEAIEGVALGVDWFVKHKVGMAPGEEKVLGEQAPASDKLAIWNVSVGNSDVWKLQTKNYTIPAWTTTWPMSPKTKKQVVVGQAHTTSIYGKTKISDQAWQFFLWSLTHADALKTQNAIIPVNYQFLKYLEFIPDEKARAVQKQRYDFLKMNHLMLFWGPKPSETQKAFTAEYDFALLGKKSTAEAMKDAAKAINDILAG